MIKPEPEMRMAFWSLTYLAVILRNGTVDAAKVIADRALADFDEKARVIDHAPDRYAT